LTFTHRLWEKLHRIWRRVQGEAEQEGTAMKKIVFFSLVLFLVACTTVDQDVLYNFDKDADFSKFKSYKWVPIKDASRVDDFRDKQIKDTVDAELAKKGLTKTNADAADLYVGYQAGIGAETKFTSYKTDWGYAPGWSGGGWYRGMGGMTTGQTSTIYVGQLAVDLYDSAGHELVWRGVVSKTIDPKAKPEKQQKNLAKAVKKLLKNYPPPVKKYILPHPISIIYIAVRITCL
jgi:hypothetical protein